MSETENAQVEEQTGPTLRLQSIENAVLIIDKAAQRGAFRGAELSGVGQVRDELAAFVIASRPVEEAVEGDEEETAEVEEEAVEEEVVEEKPKRNPRKTTKRAPAKKK